MPDVPVRAVQDEGGSTVMFNAQQMQSMRPGGAAAARAPAQEAKVHLLFGNFADSARAGRSFFLRPNQWSARSP